ncbi:hypothetical protein PPYR_10138 [Photinus pyralis]|uniref:beta-N-acetylhexosaminidase n=1 Tax=Photinus pyralis TaxID=7054 RepID=A0A5N4AFI1_PHOPY|nr:chitooligosaccharidolytic beta-N-acetylglucosaminidase [Photinus pyralis]KAB0796077.1 hypothetical protein PPYR_10138 [Photinus pyralis]
MRMLTLVITLSIFIDKSTSSSFNEDGWRWMWTCDTRSEKCRRKSEPVALGKKVELIDTFQYNSLAVCRLTCGKLGALWPKPKYASITPHLQPFHPNAIRFQISNAPEKTREFLLDNVKIFRENVLAECGPDCAAIGDTDVLVFLSANSSSLSQNWHTNESYHLEIRTKGTQLVVEILAATVFGVRHGLETLSQLIASYPIYRKLQTAQRGLVIITTARIYDEPAFPHRGLLLDTARNYLPVEAMQRQIDGMAASKLNVLHWHATDSQSFPLDLPRTPQMARYGAYSPEKVYRPNDIRHLVRYAKLRGVRIILEMDAPSHAGNGWQWGANAGLGDLAVCVNKMPWRYYCIQPPCGQLNPVNRNLYTVLSNIYQDLHELFADSGVFHMGGDEVHLGCWNSTDEIVNYLTQYGRNRTTEDFLQLWSEYQADALKSYDAVIGHKSTPIMVWSSALTEPNIITRHLPKSRYVIQTWVPSIDMLNDELLNLGYKIVVSTKDAWYLDHGFWGGTQYHGWRKVYQNRLPKHENVLGGEVCMWGELVDQHSIDNRIWPRAAAAAERLWSNPDSGTASAEPRFYRHRERLVARGIEPEALAPLWCLQNEAECA